MKYSSVVFVVEKLGDFFFSNWVVSLFLGVKIKQLAKWHGDSGGEGGEEEVAEDVLEKLK